MLHRFDVSRCCCEVNEFELDVDGVGVSGGGIRWREGTTDLDPIYYQAFTIDPPFSFGTLFKHMQCFGIGGQFGMSNFAIPVRTYSEIALHWFGIALNNDLTPRTPDQPQDYDIYVWDHVADFAQGLIDALDANGGIPRSELLGPVRWNASALDWADPGGFWDVPNIASIANPVINGGSWNDQACIFLVFDTEDQDVDATPDGRGMNPNTAGATTIFRW